MITPEDKAAAEAYCAEQDEMTTPEIIAKELPIEVYDAIRRMSDTEKVTRAFQQAQREAVLRAFEAVRVKAEESYEHDPCSSEFELNLMEALDLVTAELNAAKELK